ncbi:MAG: MerR family transcriptional regulator [Lentisphaeria bacterium]|nr:MerR family transcriptional regulator [Lentisphaeria bacterium]
MNGKNYTVMELAEQIGVPRTTINDWLARYSQYIDSTLQGKRKVYPESALAVLREIAALRNSGKAFPEIETELSAKHPIRAVPVPPQEEKPEAKPSAAPDPASEEKPGTGENSSGFAVIARQQSEEIGRLIGESFRNMEQRIQGLEKLSAAQRRLSYLWLTACICFAVLLAATGYWAWIRMRVAGEENRQLRDQQVATAARLKSAGEENRQLRDQQVKLQEQSVSLIAGNRNFQANIARLQSELKQQKQEFDQNIRAEKERLTELHRAQEKTLAAERDQARLQVREQETRLALEKEKFAAERLKLLNELEALKQQQESLKAELKAEQAKKQTPPTSPQSKPFEPEIPAAQPAASASEPPAKSPEKQPAPEPAAGKMPQTK